MDSSCDCIEMSVKLKFVRGIEQQNSVPFSRTGAVTAGAIVDNTFYLFSLRLSHLFDEKGPATVCNLLFIAFIAFCSFWTWPYIASIWEAQGKKTELSFYTTTWSSIIYTTFIFPEKWSDSLQLCAQTHQFRISSELIAFQIILLELNAFISDWSESSQGSKRKLDRKQVRGHHSKEALGAKTQNHQCWPQQTENCLGIIQSWQAILQMRFMRLESEKTRWGRTEEMCNQ